MKDDKIVDLADLQDGAILLRMRDVASILQLGESTVKAMVQRGGLPVVRCGRAVRVPRRELEAWVSQRTEWVTTGYRGLASGGGLMASEPREDGERRERAPYGEGAAYQKKDGRWTGQLRLPGGVRKTYYGSSEKEVGSKIRKARRAYDAGQLAAAPSISVANYLDGWLARVVSQSVKPKTYESARLNVERVKRHVGRARLEALTPAAIQQLYGSLLESGLSRRSVEQVHEVLHRALRQAMQWGLLVRNPADAVSVPRPRGREMETLTEAELRRLFAATQEDRLHALWVLLGTTGLRIGEALALSWDDLDLDVGRLVVRRALQRQRNAGLVFVEPKSAQSRRTVYLAFGTVDALRGHRELQRRERQFAGGEWREHGLVFCTLTGGPLEHSTVTYGFQKALRSAGLRRIRIHDLRHTAATLLLKNGVHPKVVQEFLGHSSITLTLETYSHVVPSLHVEVAARMQGIFEPNGANGSKLAATPPQLPGEEEG